MKTQIIFALIQLKNSSLLNKHYAFLKYSKFITFILTILYKEGFIQSYFVKNKILVYIRYYYTNPIFKDLKILSKPNFCKYLKFYMIDTLTIKKKKFFILTDNGILSVDSCKKKRIGGLALFSC